MGQMRLAWPRGQQEVTCGHEKQKHYANGMCVACYHRDYRRQQKAYRASKAAYVDYSLSAVAVGNIAWVRDMLPGETVDDFQDRIARGVPAND